MFARKSIDTISIYFLMNDKNNKAKKKLAGGNKRKGQKEIYM